MRHHLMQFARLGVASLALGSAWALSQAVVLTVGAICAALVAIITAAKMISGLAPVQHVWERLVEEPRDEKWRRRMDAWWNAEDGPGSRLAKLEAAADRATGQD